MLYSEKDHMEDDLTLIIVKITDGDVSYAPPFVAGKFSSSFNELKLVREFIHRFCQSLPGDKKGLRLSFYLQSTKHL